MKFYKTGGISIKMKTIRKKIMCMHMSVRKKTQRITANDDLIIGDVIIP